VYERSQPRSRIGEVVEHARADDVVESATERRDLLDGELMKFEIGEPVALAQASCRLKTRRADVDAGDVRAGIAGRVASGLRCATSGDEDLVIVAIRAGWPQSSMFDSPAGAVAPCLDVGIEITDGWRVGMTIVELGDLVAGVRAHPSPAGNLPIRFVTHRSVCRAR
jgi:hypothetical protein